MPARKLGIMLVVAMAGGLVAAGAAAAPAGLPAAAGSDTVRTNLWLAEALLGEAVQAAVRVLPPAPGAIRLVPLRDDPRNDVFVPVAAKVLGEAGYELFLPTEDETRQGAVDHVLAFSVQDIDLIYPDVGRTLGIWRNWVAREMSVSVLLEITEEASGRLLMSERVERRFSDRVGSGDLARVESDAYGFTIAEVEESGWQSRAEEFVVLGTLAGLVAIYFANTGN